MTSTIENIEMKDIQSRSLFMWTTILLFLLKSAYGHEKQFWTFFQVYEILISKKVSVLRLFAKKTHKLYVTDCWFVTPCLVLHFWDRCGAQFLLVMDARLLIDNHISLVTAILINFDWSSDNPHTEKLNSQPECRVICAIPFTLYFCLLSYWFFVYWHLIAFMRNL